MFRQRLITSLILAPLVLLAIFYLNPAIQVGIVFFAVLISGWEWTQLIPFSQRVLQSLFIVALSLTMILCHYWFDYWLFAGLLTWIFILLAVVTFPASIAIWGYPVVVALAGLILLSLFANALAAVYQQSQGKGLIVYILCIVWAADTGAYLIGKASGRHKLIPLVSPGKTIEGTVGGIVLAMLVAAAGYFYFEPINGRVWFCLAIFTVLISILGDLSISILKRRSKVKDTGNIFPGHGGMLDRFDSMIAAVPLFYCGLQFWPPGI